MDIGLAAAHLKTDAQRKTESEFKALAES